MEDHTTVLGLVSVIVVTVGGWVTLLLQQRGQAREVSDVREQVSPGDERDTSLRDDLDAVGQAVSAVRVAVLDHRAAMGELRDEVHGLRNELIAERIRAVAVEERIICDLEQERVRSVHEDGRLSRMMFGRHSRGA